MIQSSELRIGNYVIDENGNIGQLDGIRRSYQTYEVWLSSVEYIDKDYSLIDELSPIPLTEEWIKN